MWVRVVMSSGTAVVFETNNLETTRDRLNGGFTGMTWDKLKGSSARLHSIEVSQVVAITTHKRKRQACR